MSVPDFSYLNDLAVTGEELSEFTIRSITLPNGKSPTLIGRHAGESNPNYINKVLKGSVQSAKQVRKGNVNVGMVQEGRDEDRELYPKFVLTGWYDVCGGDAKDVPFSVEACAGFLGAMPDDIFDEVREHYANTANFRQTIEVDDAVAKGKT